MRDLHKWEDLRPEEFYQEFERRPLVYWACGAMEEHGLHNALGVDPYTGYEICRRALDISGGILYPLVPFAPAGWPSLSREQLRGGGPNDLFPPSLWVSTELCERIYVELMESMADLGFKVCIAFGGHWPADGLLQQIEKQHKGRIGNMKFWGGGTWRILQDVVEKKAANTPNIDGHGMMWETSLVTAFRPDWVDLERAVDIKQSPLPSQLKNESDAKIAEIANANSDFGNHLLGIAAHRLAKLATEMLEN